MGVEYRLVKPATGESYLLGKPALRPPVADYRRRIRGLHPIRDFAQVQEAMQPGSHAMWRIGSDDGDCALTRFSERWTEETLAPVVQTACLDEDDEEMALAITRDLLAWAGPDQVVLLPDNLEPAEVGERLGVRIAAPRDVREIYQVTTR